MNSIGFNQSVREPLIPDCYCYAICGTPYGRTNHGAVDGPLTLLCRVMYPRILFGPASSFLDNATCLTSFVKL